MKVRDLARGGAVAPRALEHETLVELRRRFAWGTRNVSQRVLEELNRDARAGARQLGALLLRRRERDASERRRLGRLFALETGIRETGHRVAGVDEVGMGPLAGPVVAAAVILPDLGECEKLVGLRDSKELSKAARERLDGEIRRVAVAVSIGVATRGEIDRINIYQAGLLAMRRAIDGLEPAASYSLVDARTLPGLRMAQRAVIGGDGKVASIAAASVVAKVYRDGQMLELDARYPDYGFSRNQGYGTVEHLRALERWGPSPEHRRSTEPVRRSEARALEV